MPHNRSADGPEKGLYFCRDGWNAVQNLSCKYFPPYITTVITRPFITGEI